ncbi:MAG TPA: TolC family protein [Chondromyces sp.]|nr:TolC family protein [Chondromyces sp.]
MRRRFFHGATLSVLLAAAGMTAAQTAPEAAPASNRAVADRILESIEDLQLRMLLGEVLERNPRLARLAADAAATAQRAPQVKKLPDPTASVTWFVMPPETRVGPQRVSVNLMQRLPWFGTLQVDEQAVLWDAAADRAVLEAARLEVLTAARADYHELQFLAAEELLVAEDRATLSHYAELALARYASGVGLDQPVIKIQAEITRIGVRLIEIAARRSAVVARLNAMRDRPQTTPVLVAELGTPDPTTLELGVLRPLALERRPEMAAAFARVQAAALRVESSKNEYRPDLVFGLNYVDVGGRDDAAGRLAPPEDNGQDILGLTGGISIPLWKSSLAAGVEEGVQRRIAAEERSRETTAAIDAALGDLAHRIPLLEEQVELYDEVLIVQARQSLESAESAYAAGTAGALDLLDAERVLLQVRIAAARARADLNVAHARLEGAVAGPLEVE